VSAGSSTTGAGAGAGAGAPGGPGGPGGPGTGSGAGAAQPIATKLMANNKASGINNIFFLINKNSFI